MYLTVQIMLTQNLTCRVNPKQLLNMGLNIGSDIQPKFNMGINSVSEIQPLDILPELTQTVASRIVENWKIGFVDHGGKSA